jgi:CRISPR system Cascade subunit CasA
MKTFNLLEEAWIPVRRRSGACSWLTPWQMTESDDPPVELNSPRPDFNGALAQFLIGLVQTVMTPEDSDAWEEHFEEPPSPEDLKEAMEPYREVFWLDGSGPRFFQDLELEESEKDSVGIEGLLIDAPGANTIKSNKDLFIHRDRVEAMSLSIAAMALLTLQTNAPAGGAGHRTSLRGGGPLTTLVLGRTLWETAWLNILTKPDLHKLPGDVSLTEQAAIFPWMGPTRTSQKRGGSATAPHQVHPLHYFWAMPRRIRLHIEGEGRCTISDAHAPKVVRTYTTKPNGFNYEGDYRHPLTPYTRATPKKPFLPRKGQPTGLSYRDWPTLTLRGSDLSEPAYSVAATYQEERLEFLDAPQGRLWIFGYDMDNMKARCWYDGTTPLFSLAPEGKSKRFADLARQCVDASEYARKSLYMNTCQAMFRRPKDVKGDLSFIDQQLWSATEARFYGVLQQLRRALLESAPLDGILEGWLKTLSDACQSIFKEHSQLQGEFMAADVKRVAEAWNSLSRMTHPNSPKFRKQVDLAPISRS